MSLALIMRPAPAYRCSSSDHSGNYVPPHRNWPRQELLAGLQVLDVQRELFAAHRVHRVGQQSVGASGGRGGLLE